MQADAGVLVVKSDTVTAGVVGRVILPKGAKLLIGFEHHKVQSFLNLPSIKSQKSK